MDLTFLAVQVPVGLFMVRYGAATDFAEPTGKLYDAHKLIGLAILLLGVARLIYRLAHGAPADEPTLAPWEKLVSHITHWAIYALLIVVPLLGLARHILLRPVRAVRHQAAGPGGAGRR